MDEEPVVGVDADVIVVDVDVTVDTSGSNKARPEVFLRALTPAPLPRAPPRDRLPPRPPLLFDDMIE